MTEFCAICGCKLHRSGEYARPTIKGRSHATKHHYVAERFFGRTANRPGKKRTGVFKECPWGLEGKFAVYCYECHEELLHNPVFTPENIAAFSQLVLFNGLGEQEKTESKENHGERIKLLNQVIRQGLLSMSE